MTHLAVDLKRRNLHYQDWRDHLTVAFNPLDPAKTVPTEKREQIERIAFSKDQLGETRAPPEVETAFQDVIAKGHGDRFLLRMHPLLKRWTVFERSLVVDETGRQHDGYYVYVYAAETDWNRSFLADDYVGDPIRGDLRGCCGNYRLPTRADFEWLVANVDHWRLSKREIATNILRAKRANKASDRNTFLQFALDFYEYNENGRRDLMAAVNNNRSKFRSYAPLEEARKNKWVEIERTTSNGQKYRERARVGSPSAAKLTDELASMHAAIEADIDEKLAKLKAFDSQQKLRRAAEASQGMVRRGKTL